MASRLENAARNAIGGDSIMDGREPMKTDEIIAKYPEGICISAIAKNTYNGSTYPVFNFAEEPSKYFSGGTALSKWVDGLIEDYDGNLAELNSDIKKEYLKIKLVKTRTKKGYNFTKVIFIGAVPVEKFGGENYVDENGKKIDADTGEVLSDDDEDPFN